MVTHELHTFDKIFIGGEWIEPRAKKFIDSVDPATEQVWASVAEAGPEEVDLAVDAARQAAQGPWTRSFTASQRGEHLRKFAHLLRGNVERIARLESRDNGKPLRDTKGEIAKAADWLDFFAGGADKLNGAQIPVRPDALAYTRHEPVGVVAAILPWNSPVMMAAWKLGPALAAGNAVILKPAEQTPVSALELGRLSQEAGIPAGVINVLPGYGPVAGAALTKHPGVKKVAFTGDWRTASKIMEAASGSLKRCTFECGGKSPFIIFEDADLEKALVVALNSAFRSTGQSCSVASRIFVQRPIYEGFAAAFAERAKAIRVGNPFDERTHIGPQTSADQLAKTKNYISLGLESGARLIAGGGRPQALDRGYYVEPTVFADVRNDSRLAQEEVFGPVIAVLPFEDETEAISLANESNYGLVAAVWTSDIKRAHRVAAAVEAGLVCVNTYGATHWMLPYGGFKLSGIGRENSMDSLLEYTEVKSVFVELSDQIPIDRFAV